MIGVLKIFGKPILHE